MKTITTIVITVFLLLFGYLVINNMFNNKAKNYTQPYGELKEQNGFKYVLTEIEGRKFIAYQTSYNFWNLAGPID